MTGYCGQFDPNDDYIPALSGYIDCQVQQLGQHGYLSLSAPGSFLPVAVTGLLTIYVAFIGYRLLLGEAPGARSVVLIVARLGVVLALSTQWPAYQAVVYNVVIHGPSEIVATIGGVDHLPARLQKIYDHIDSATTKNEGAQPAIVQATPSQHPAGPDKLPESPLKLAAISFLVSAAGGLVAVRIIAGVLLAVGPVFIAFLLFDGLRGLFEGWLRGLGGVMLSTIALTLVFNLQVAVMDAQTDHIGDIHSRLANEILATTLVFGIILAAAVAASFVVAASLRIPIWRMLAERSALHNSPQSLAPEQPHFSQSAPQSHARRVADAARAAQTRDSGIIMAATQMDRRTPEIVAGAPAVQRFGNSQRRTQHRVSASLTRRDTSI